MSTIRLFLDEDVWPGLAVVLREHSFDARHAYELERGEISDADQLAYSSQEGRAILTHNVKDFVPLAIEYFFVDLPHAGIILSPQIEKGELVRRTLNLLSVLSAESSRRRGLPASSHTTGHAGPHPAVRQAQDN